MTPKGKQSVHNVTKPKQTTSTFPASANRTSRLHLDEDDEDPDQSTSRRGVFNFEEPNSPSSSAEDNDQQPTPPKRRITQRACASQPGDKDMEAMEEQDDVTLRKHQATLNSQRIPARLLSASTFSCKLCNKELNMGHYDICKSGQVLLHPAIARGVTKTRKV